MEKGKLDINGLGGSYGQETLIYYKMLANMGPPVIKKWKFLKRSILAVRN